MLMKQGDFNDTVQNVFFFKQGNFQLKNVNNIYLWIEIWVFIYVWGMINYEAPHNIHRRGRSLNTNCYLLFILCMSQLSCVEEYTLGQTKKI